MKKTFVYEVKRAESYGSHGTTVREGFEMEVNTPEDELKFEELKGELKIKIHKQAETGLLLTKNPSWMSDDTQKVHDMMMGKTDGK